MRRGRMVWQPFGLRPFSGPVSYADRRRGILSVAVRSECARIKREPLSNMTTKFCLLLLMVSPVIAEDLSALCADRTAIERVYYNHRLGEKPPFEQVTPPALIERLVKEDLHKEAVLKKVYDVEVSDSQLDAEVRRIHTTTRAPETLVELEAALGNDTNRFARAVAQPIVVERLLRERFENDDKLHAPERRQAEEARGSLLKAQQEGAPLAKQLGVLKQGHTNEVTETTWTLGAPPQDKTGPENRDEIEIKKRFGEKAQIIASPASEKRKSYFEDLPPRLQEVLRVQLRRAGDVSAVIETPSSFLLYVAKERTPETLAVAALTIPKRSYEQWLTEQKEIAR